MQVHHPDKYPPENCKDLGAAIGTPMSPDQRHIGLLYTDEQDQVRFLHLAWHYILRDEDAPLSGYVWLDSGLDPVNQTVISQYCQLIAEKNQVGGLPYGLVYMGELVFEPSTGAWTGPSGHGLTCASFILALFKAKGFELIDMIKWPKRDEDRAWGENILTMLSARASPEHIEAQQEALKKGLVRFRPGEVAGAISSTSPPVTFEQASQLSHTILKEIHEYNKRMGDGHDHVQS